MAACKFGATSVKVSNLNLETKLGTVQPLLGLRIRTPPAKWQSLTITKQLHKSVIGCKCLSSSGLLPCGYKNWSMYSKKFCNELSLKISFLSFCEIIQSILYPYCFIDDTAVVTIFVDSSKEAKSNLTKSDIPNVNEVESLLTRICDTSSIAEFELNMGGFRLLVTRNLMGQSYRPPTIVSAPATSDTIVEAPDQNESIATPSLAIAKPVPSSVGIQTFLDKAADEGLMILQSPKVGYFRRSRSIKDKRAPPSCKENELVKEGQVLCFVEQFGGEVPIESDVFGEVVKILREDGDPVGYDDALIAVLPFPGIKQLN